MMLEHKRGKLFVETLGVLPVQKMPESFKLYVSPVRHSVPDETDSLLVVALGRAADKVERRDLCIRCRSFAYDETYVVYKYSNMHTHTHTHNTRCYHRVRG
jgi:hypothetical protein